MIKLISLAFGLAALAIFVVGAAVVIFYLYGLALRLWRKRQKGGE